MAERSWSAQDVKNRFSTVVEAARHKPQTVTKHGKPAVERAQAPSFADVLLAIPQDDGQFPRLTARPRDLEL